jgi:hypothetical protein
MTKTERKKWTVADLFLILLAILSLVGIFIRFFGIRRQVVGEKYEYSVGVVWENVDKRTAFELREGEVVYTASGEVFGRVLSMEQKPSLVELKKDGKIYRVESEERLDVRIELTVSGRESDGQILRGGREALMIGQTLRLYSMTAELPVQVTRIGEKALL